MDEKQQQREYYDHLHHRYQQHASPLLPEPTTTTITTTTSGTMPIRQRGRLRPAAILVTLFVVAYVVFSGAVRTPMTLNRPAAVREVVDAARAAEQAPIAGVVKEEEEEEDGGSAAVLQDGQLVPLEAHVMSKCPDTQDCLKQLILPAMQQVFDKVNFTLSFLGTPTENDGVACKHGPEECMGNIIELCAAELYPDAKTWLGFTMCLTREYWHIPQRELIEDCALEHALDVDALNDCASRDDGAHGMALLRDSVRRTADAGVTKSCTVRLNNEVYCVRDDDKWTECPHGPGVNDLVISIEKLHRATSASSTKPGSSL
jgi:hypothetical protein